MEMLCIESSILEFYFLTISSFNLLCHRAAIQLKPPLLTVELLCQSTSPLNGYDLAQANPSKPLYRGNTTRHQAWLRSLYTLRLDTTFTVVLVAYYLVHIPPLPFDGARLTHMY